MKVKQRLERDDNEFHKSRVFSAGRGQHKRQMGGSELIAPLLVSLAGRWCYRPACLAVALLSGSVPLPYIYGGVLCGLSHF